MDGFDQDYAAGECADGGVVLGGFLASQSDALEALELAVCVLDPGTGLVEDFGKESWFVSGVIAIGNDRADAALASSFSIDLGVVSLVGHHAAGLNIGADVERDFELSAVALLAAGQMEVERVAPEVGLKVDFCREPTARAAECLAILPPFAPAADT